MRIIVDAQLPPALVRALKRHGFDSSHVLGLKLLEASDRAIWNWALKHKAVILTKDEDFVQLCRNSVAGPPVIWLRIGNTANNYLMRHLMPRMSEIVRAIDSGERLIEVR